MEQQDYKILQMGRKQEVKVKFERIRKMEEEGKKIKDLKKLYDAMGKDGKAYRKLLKY